MFRTYQITKNSHIPEHRVSKNTKAINRREGTSYADSVIVLAHKYLSAMFWLYPQGIASSICLVKAPLFLLAPLLQHQVGPAHGQ